MPNSNEPTRTYNDIPPLTAVELGGVIARVKEGEEIIGNVPLPVPVNKGGTNATTAPTARTNLGLGTLATQNANAVAITGGAISGITDLAVADGGTGTSNGSITGTGALTFAAGGTDQNLTLTPSGSGNTIITGSGKVGIGTTLPQAKLNVFDSVAPWILVGQATEFIPPYGSFINQNSAAIEILTNNGNQAGHIVMGGYGTAAGSGLGQFSFICPGTSGSEKRGAAVISILEFDSSSAVSANLMFFTTNNGNIADRLTISSDGKSSFLSSTDSTSTTTGAVVINGGLGVVKNVNIGGNLRFAGGTVPATATSAGTTGDIRYDGSHLYICTATNTWVRTALSTW